MKIKLTIPVLAGMVMCAGGLSAQDFVRSSLRLGGYLLESTDAADHGHGPLYHLEAFTLAAQKGSFDVSAAVRYSNLHASRPQRYETGLRPALLKLRYTAPSRNISAAAGRDLAVLTGRSIFFDGAGVSWQAVKRVRLEVFGGLGVPSVYTEGLISSPEDQSLAGTRISVNAPGGILVIADGLKAGSDDKGSAGLAVRKRIKNLLSLSGQAVADLNANALSRYTAAGMLTVRRNDYLRISVAGQGETVDSTRYYEYFINRAHSRVTAAYAFNPDAFWQVTLQGGVLLYDGFTGGLAGLDLTVGNGCLSVYNRLQENVRSLDVSAGYEQPLLSWLRWSAGGDLFLYKQVGVDSSRQAISVVTGLTVTAIPAVKAILQYEFISNRTYQADHRAFAGLEYTLFKELDKK